MNNDQRHRKGASRPTIGILLSNFNHAEHLERSLDGIFGQTRAADEVILLDDGSTDNSLEILKGYVSDFPSTQLIVHRVNRGLMSSIAELLSAATSDYIVWAASDDQLLPDFLEKSAAVLSKYPGAGVCFSEFSVVGAGDEKPINYSRESPHTMNRGIRVQDYRLHDIPEFLSPTWLLERYSTDYLCMSSNTALMHRSKLVAAGGFASELRWYSDWFAVSALAFRYGACAVPSALTVYHADSGSFSSTGMSHGRQQRRVLRAWLSLLMERRNSDLRSMFARAPAVFAPFGHQMILAGIAKPRFWSLAFTNFRWYIFGWPSRSGLSWPQLVKKALVRLFFRRHQNALFR